MSSTTPKEVAHDIFPYLIEYKDGTIERTAGTQRTPPGFDTLTGVTSKDIILEPDDDTPALAARLYHPSANTATTATNEKLPVVLYFHGGAFLIASPAEPLYHSFCNALAASARALVVSVDYRLAPENPLPAAFDDAWAALQWVAAHASREGGGPEGWLNQGVNFGRVFLVGDSAGATLAHHVACQLGMSMVDESQSSKLVCTWISGRVKIQGIVLIHPYFWGKNPIGSERFDPIKRDIVDKWWEYVCPSDEGCNDPLINPFASGAPSLDEVACTRVLVMVARKDILRDRGRLYYEEMVRRKKNYDVEFYETLEEDHVFFIFNPQCDKSKELMAKLTSFINNVKEVSDDTMA